MLSQATLIKRLDFYYFGPNGYTLFKAPDNWILFAYSYSYRHLKEAAVQLLKINDQFKYTKQSSVR